MAGRARSPPAPDCGSPTVARGASKQVGRAAIPAVDWSQPWLRRWRARGEPLEARAREVGLVAALNSALGGAAGSCTDRLRFVDQAQLPPGEPYEAFIARTHRVPTRHNLHDLFNGLVWLERPLLKRRLSECHAAHLATAAAGAPRGAVRDRLTLFDENGARLQAPRELVDALRARDWRALFIQHRSLWAEARLELFGHALMEKLTRPRKPVTAHVWVIDDAPSSPTVGGDVWMGCVLTPESIARTQPLPLPVLGVPGWWEANEATGFYDDADVFRPRTTQTAAVRPLFASNR